MSTTCESPSPAWMEARREQDRDRMMMMMMMRMRRRRMTMTMTAWMVEPFVSNIFMWRTCCPRIRLCRSWFQRWCGNVWWCSRSLSSMVPVARWLILLVVHPNHPNHHLLIIKVYAYKTTYIWRIQVFSPTLRTIATMSGIIPTHPGRFNLSENIIQLGFPQVRMKHEQSFKSPPEQLVEDLCFWLQVCHWRNKMRLKVNVASTLWKQHHCHYITGPPWAAPPVSWSLSLELPVFRIQVWVQVGRRIENGRFLADDFLSKNLLFSKGNSLEMDPK